MAPTGALLSRSRWRWRCCFCWSRAPALNSGESGVGGSDSRTTAATREGQRSDSCRSVVNVTNLLAAGGFVARWTPSVAFGTNPGRRILICHVVHLSRGRGPGPSSAAAALGRRPPGGGRALMSTAGRGGARRARRGGRGARGAGGQKRTQMRADRRGASGNDRYPGALGHEPLGAPGRVPSRPVDGRSRGPRRYPLPFPQQLFGPGRRPHRPRTAARQTNSGPSGPPPKHPAQSPRRRRSPPGRHAKINHLARPPTPSLRPLSVDPA